MNQKYPEPSRLWLNQFDMAMTQWSLIGLVGMHPKQCGFHRATKEELAEYVYFWRVIGYCMGIEDRFNICENDFEESVAYFHCCFDRGYRPHLVDPTDTVKVGMFQLTEGVFLGLNTIIPKFIFSYEAFMKYWYDALGKLREHPAASRSIRITFGIFPTYDVTFGVFSL